MGKKVKVIVDVEAGQVSVDGALYLGETADVEFVGVTDTPRLYILDGDGVTCLADNIDDEDVLDLRSADLRRAFGAGKGMKTFKSVVLGVSGTDDVLASGIVTIRWSPVVYDEAHTPATLRGPKGDKGDTGHIGPMGPLSQVKDPDTGKWYNVYARVDGAGNRVLSLEQSDSDPTNGGAVVMKSDFADLKTRVDAAEEDIDDVESRATAVESRATAVEGRATALEGRATTIEGNVTTVAGRATALEGRATSVESRATALETQGTSLAGRTTTLETTASGLRTDLNVLTSKAVTIEQTDGVKRIAPNVDVVRGTAFACVGMPSDSIVNVTFPETTGGLIQFADEATTAPYSGWVNICKKTAGTGQRMSVSLYKGDTLIMSSMGYDYTTGRDINVSMPVPKGFSIKVDYTLSGELTRCVFIKAQAEVAV